MQRQNKKTPPRSDFQHLEPRPPKRSQVTTKALSSRHTTPNKALALPEQLWRKVLDFAGVNHVLLVPHSQNEEEAQRERGICEELLLYNIMENQEKDVVGCPSCKRDWPATILTANKWSFTTTRKLLTTHRTLAHMFDNQLVPNSRNTFPDLTADMLYRAVYISDARELEITLAGRALRSLTWTWIMPHTIPNTTPPLSIQFCQCGNSHAEHAPREQYEEHGL
ncbi:unnamed protein product [Symbiodinium natans]|uniref:Uncharacterized protein n=1 Tax=Symbiodinium natans TaxID=878477 RepID=A0A812KVA2_9DINO|nr:unnamed protein product [Symbiodinium natans]